MTMKPPPPTPQENGSVTPRTRGCGHRSVDGVAAAAQRVDGGLRREHVDRRGRASRSGRGRRTVRAGVRQGAYLSGERGDRGDEQDGE